MGSLVWTAGKNDGVTFLRRRIKESLAFMHAGLLLIAVDLLILYAIWPKVSGHMSITLICAY